MKRQVLFLCTGNSARSPERRVGSVQRRDKAGYVHPLAPRVLAEIGTDHRSAHSKSADEFRDVPFDLVVRCATMRG